MRKIGKVAVAVSGGADSLALALMLKEDGANMIALTVDHGLRKESAAEAKAVGRILAKQGIAHEILKVSAKVPAGNIMEWAREQRYQSLFAYCKAHKIKTLYVAHHQDDQVETFFLNLERGSGLRGLSGMREVSQQQGITILRPLLHTPKSELRAYLKKKKIKPIEDPTNSNTSYKRNRLRQAVEEVFPDNPDLPNRITQAMTHLAQADAFIAEMAEKAFSTTVSFPRRRESIHQKKMDPRVKPEDDMIIIDGNLFLQLHPLLQYRVLLATLMRLSPKKKPPRSESILTLLNRMEKGEKAFTLHGVKGALKKRNWQLVQE